MDGQILATTLPREDRPALAELLRRAERSPNVTLGPKASKSTARCRCPLSSVGDSGVPGAGPVALILRSRDGNAALPAVDPHAAPRDGGGGGAPRDSF